MRGLAKEASNATTVLTCEDERDRGTHEAEERRAGRAESRSSRAESGREEGVRRVVASCARERTSEAKLCSRRCLLGERGSNGNGGALNRGTTARSRERRCSPCFASTLHERSGRRLLGASLARSRASSSSRQPLSRSQPSQRRRYPSLRSRSSCRTTNTTTSAFSRSCQLSSRHGHSASLTRPSCRLDVPDSAAFVPDTEEEDGLPQFELVLHHPERQRPPVCGGGGWPLRERQRVPAERAQFQVDALRQFKALCDRLLPGLRTQSHLYTLIHLCDRTHTVTV